MNHPDLNQILIFVKLVEAGSFTKAAELLSQPKSRISRRLAALEQSLEIQLVYRTTRQMQLTEAGQEYYRQCAPLIQNLEGASQSLRQNSEELTGTLRVTAPEDFGKLILSHLLDDFLKRHPKLRFDVVLSGTYLDLVKESIDVALRIGNLKDASLKSKKVLELSSIFVASPSFLERQEAITRPEQLKDLPCLTMHFHKKNQWRLLKDKQEIRIGVDGPLHTNSPEFNYHLCLLGRGVGMLPRFLCEEALASGKLVQILKGWSSQSIPIHLLTPARREIPLKTKMFMDFVTEKLRNWPS